MPDGPDRIGRYEIRSTLGQGGMGAVYQGWDTRLELEVAIKVLIPGQEEDKHPEELKRFLREVKISRTLKHPNIVSVYDVDDDPASGRTYIVMELIKGKPLNALVKERQLTFREIVTLVGQLANGLDYAAQAGVVHRDVKPANVLVDPETLIPKLVDFGVARIEGTNVTHSQTVTGTPHYMSPEQWRGEAVDGRSDLFSLGAVLYELLTSQKAFPGETLPTIMMGVLDPTRPLPPADLRPGIIPDALSTAVMKALAKDPKDRFQRGNEMQAALEAAMAASPETTLTIRPTTLPPVEKTAFITTPTFKLADPVAPKLARPPVSTEEAEIAPAPAPARSRKAGARVLVVVILLASLLAAAWIGWPAVNSRFAPPVTIQLGVLKEIARGQFALLADGDVLLPTERIAVFVKPVAEAYIYAWRIDPSGRTFRVFPNPEVTLQRNPVQPGPGHALWLPSANNRHWFYIGNKAGVEEIVIVALSEPLRRLKDPIGLLSLIGVVNAGTEERMLGDHTRIQAELALGRDVGTIIPPPGSPIPPNRTLEGNAMGLYYQIRLKHL